MHLTDTETVLEVGTGEGNILNRLNQIKRFTRLEGIDISSEAIDTAKKLLPSLKFSLGSAYELSYKDEEFDMLVLLEVLEHLEDYEKALSEIKRVSKKYVLISVPVEPLWRMFNVARFSYLPSFGNTPGHIQHWDKKSFLSLIEKYFKVEKILYPLPWQIALCKK